MRRLKVGKTHLPEPIACKTNSTHRHQPRSSLLLERHCAGLHFRAKVHIYRRAWSDAIIRQLVRTTQPLAKASRARESARSVISALTPASQMG
ncbi:hypothetical protein AXF42_Ash008323 [Apostasia shenzhenica]|uniref:Uncharacterized protein n=1 Tax=Apostasia shenzhenica TaxID=1088818 RepID=A0A2I0AXK6_9ASPA|nr:hypothetical protein AXF42_Ash008323 [Apostasia shenzhenica]